MQAMDDMALLQEYAARNSETAFAELVSRRVGFVYSAALRQVRDPHLAEEVTQAVFIILAQKAGRISDKTILAGWLFKTTRFAAIAQTRADVKRRRHEQEAQMQTELQPTAPDLFWEQMSPLLDEALATLGETDRQAVLLRFFENKSLAEVGNSLGTGEDTARKRVARALEKLHRYFSKRGVSSTTAIIAGAVLANSIQAAPVALAKSVTAVAIVKGSIAAVSTLSLVKGTMKIMTWMKFKFAVCVGATAMLAGGVATIALSGDGFDSATGSASSVFQLRIVLDAASADSEILTHSTTNSESGKVFNETLHVQKKVLLDQSVIASASVATNSFVGRPIDIIISFTLTPKGKEQFAKLTRENIGRRLAIVVGGKVISAPIIQSEITSGNGQISGHFTAQEATRLAAILNQSARN
jgi:RNA polymerase sigma factor (sigma-70 family)